METGREKYGGFYWGVDCTSDEHIWLYADEVEFAPAGSVVFWHATKDGSRIVNLALSAGQWKRVYAASLIDGGMVAVEHLDDKSPSSNGATSAGPHGPTQKKTRKTRTSSGRIKP